MEEFEDYFLKFLLWLSRLTKAYWRAREPVPKNRSVLIGVRHIIMYNSPL